MEFNKLLPWIDKLTVDDYRPRLARTRVIGHSVRGENITMHSWIHNPHEAENIPTIFAWAFPHPDEPLGHIALSYLARGLDEHQEHIPAANWHLVLQPDPDLSLFNLGVYESDIKRFITNTFKPHHLGHEVDYGFPSDYKMLYLPEFFQGNHRCLEGLCEHDTCPQGITGCLPESLALVEGMKIVKPDLVISLHNAYCSGAYTYLLKRPDDELLQTFNSLNKRFGYPNHETYPFEGGRRWKPRAFPADLREPTIESKVRRITRLGFDENERYLLPISASMWVETHFPEADFFVPEAGLFTSNDFENQTPVQETRTLEGSHYTTRQKNERVVLRGKYMYPDGTEEEILYAMHPASRTDLLGTHDHILTHGMLGVEAVMLRRWAMKQADIVWDRVKTVRPRDLYSLDRAQINVSAHHINDKMLRLYRTRDPYLSETAVKAHQAIFQATWTISTLAKLGSLANFCIRYDVDYADLNILIDQLIDTLPEQYHWANHVAGAQSQLARILYLAYKKSSDSV